ncbi:SHOCT domain-containing protein [Tessaracoccus sp. HDW20]|uniref:SHOCT domain-containing protein n=1 Tax=Tessaracoccus coleopterorum TaxID=2714950 RepID=UPI0018D27D82|nr:SHOCT domain-containing protein [Tessaracoccus coleopterorum]NHB85009.1 SHOCT domain-containing protein [Tessaracoccus coleopterorum]
MIRRRTRPGLLGTAARTAVIAGTASSVAGKADAKRQAQAADQAELAAARAQAQQTAIDEAAARAVAAQQPVAPAPAAAAAPDPLAQLERLATLHEKGMLTAEEFTAAKAKLLGL